MNASQPPLPRPAPPLQIPGAGSLAEFSNNRAVLLLFLRHVGCIFCQEALAGLTAQREQLNRRRIAVVVVHFGNPDEAARLLARFPGTEPFYQMSDPDRRLYESFGVRRGSLAEIAGVNVCRRGTLAVLRGFRPGRPSGDLHQMSGVFLVRDGLIVAEHRYRDSTDHPDWPAFLASAPGPAEPKIDM